MLEHCTTVVTRTKESYDNFQQVDVNERVVHEGLLDQIMTVMERVDTECASAKVAKVTPATSYKIT